MTISEKRRRRLTVDGRDFLWWIADDEDNLYRPSIVLVSTDQRIYVKYGLQRGDVEPTIRSVGAELHGNSMQQGMHSVAPAPQLDESQGITPRQVAELARFVLRPSPGAGVSRSRE